MSDAGDAVREAELDAELKAMREVDAALAALPRETGARGRVLRWACDRFGVTVPAPGEGEQRPRIVPLVHSAPGRVCEGSCAGRSQS